MATDKQHTMPPHARNTHARRGLDRTRSVNGTRRPWQVLAGVMLSLLLLFRTSAAGKSHCRRPADVCVCYDVTKPKRPSTVRTGERRATAAAVCERLTRQCGTRGTRRRTVPVVLWWGGGGLRVCRRHFHPHPPVDKNRLAARP